MPTVALAEARFLRGLQRDFKNTAEMLVTRAREIPDHPYVRFYEETITYAQMNDRANRVADGLRQRGVRRGDVIAVLIPNAPPVYDVMFGAQKIGAVPAVLNFTLKAPEIAYLIEDCRPGIVFVAAVCNAELQKALAETGHRPEVIVVPGADDSDIAREDFTAWETIMAPRAVDEALESLSASDPFLLLYSSGTTGHPKGILLTHGGQLCVCRDMARLGLVSGGDVMLLMLPMYHVNPICVWTFPMMFCGQTICLRKGFSPADFWPAIVANKVTILMGVPAMYSYVYQSIPPETVDKANLRLRYAFCGAAPLPVELIRGFKERFDVDIIEGYGLTEGTGVVAANPPLGMRKTGSVGQIFTEQDVRIVDLDGQPVSDGRRGEIWIRGAAVMAGYRNNPAATTETLVDGWLRTGDVGVMDTDGFLYIVDRIKDMINRGGENIYPREIEEALAGHPDIAEAAVIGVPDRDLGERVKAVVQPARPGALSAADITAFLADRVARQKIPEIIEITEALPRNASGKVLKRVLRERQAGTAA